MSTTQTKLILRLNKYVVASKLSCIEMKVKQVEVILRIQKQDQKKFKCKCSYVTYYFIPIQN